MITFAFGVVLGIVPAILYGRIGGDEKITVERPELIRLLHYIHHWMIGAIVLLGGALFYYANPTPIWEFVIGVGTGMAVDDLLFHSFENYFQRRIDYQKESQIEA